MRVAALLAVVSLALSSILAVSSDAQSAANGDAAQAPLDDAPPPLRAALLEGRYDAALELVEGLEKSQPERGDFWLLMRGLVHDDRHDPAKAEAAYAELESRFPKSAWRTKARFARVDDLRLLHRHAEAEPIVAAESTRLLSEPRRRELALLALKLADDRLEPTKDEHGVAPPADPARALALYDEVLALDPPADVVARTQFWRGKALEAAQKPDEAITAFQRFLASTKLAPTALDVVDARLHLGRVLVGRGRRGEARRVFEDLAQTLAASGADAQLAKRRGDALLAIAATWDEKNRDEAPLAVAALERFLEQSPRHDEAWNAALRVADVWTAIGRAEDAIAALEKLIARPDDSLANGTKDVATRDAASRVKAEAEFRRGQLLLGQGRPELASAAFAACIARDPTGPRWAQAQAATVEAERQLADVARRRGDFAGARAALGAFVDHHPLDGRVLAIRLEVGDLFLAEADAKLAKWRQTTNASADAKPALELQKELDELARRAVDEWQQLARLAPNTEEASEALWRVATAQHDRLLELDRALETWRAITFGHRAPEAAAMLREVTTPSLAVTTARTFRTNETPLVHLRVRNVAEVKVELHPLDLETYFRKFLSLGGVEALDLDLIAPAKSFTAKIDGFTKLKAIEQDLPVEMDGPGAYVVAVVAEGRRATTLLLRSDVEVVVKSSRRDLLVFAQDLRTGTVAKDVELLLDLGDAGGGTRRQLTGRTDADGVLHLTSDLLAAADGVRAFAKRGGHVAFSGVDLARFQSSAPLEPRGLVFTDRPAYRPGQHVEAKALLREVRDGRFAFDAGSRWTLAVADPRGRVVRSSPLVLGDYGTLADAFDLDALAPLGTWSLRVSRTDGPTFSGSFQVQEFALERVTLDLELPRRVFYRGETVELDAVARWQHGAPVVDAPIRIALPDGQLVDLRTDSAGRAHAKFETKDQPSETALAFSATLLEQGLTTGANAFLAVREFAMELSLPRRAVLADEPFAVELATKLRDGAPIGHAATVTLLRLDEAGAEVRVTQQPLTTDEKSGAGRVDVRLAKGGRYVVRAEAVDRFGNPVSTQGTVDVSGADDAVKLRLLSDRASLEVGESTSVRLVNRAGAGLMLLTWESDTGVRWKVVNAADGTSPIEVAPDAELVPGFVLAAAAMRGTQLHTASVPFQVTRALKLTVTPRASPARPGGETTVDVLATDPLGRPVQAEVALAVVDDALLRLFADPTTAPSRVFTLPGADPKPHRTDASCTFHYDGATHEIAAAVLAEEERKRADERWAEKRVNLAARLDKLGYAQNAAPAADGPATPAIGGFALADDVEAAAEAMDAGTVPAKDGRALGGGGGRGAGGMLGHRAGPGNAARPNGFRATPEGEFAETAYFNPSIVTGPDGRASVTFKLPGQSTKYRLIARGITKETRAGETSAELVAKADLFAELVLPPRLVEGDAPRLLARVFHAPGVTGSAELRLRMVAGDRTVSMPATVDLAKGETVEFLFEPLPAVPLVENVALELVATATRGGEKVDTKYEAQLAVRPYGIEVADARSGELAASRTFFLELPAGRSFRSRQLDVVVSPSTQRFLLDEALERNPIHRRYEDASGLHELTQADVASELFGVCGVLELARTRPTAAEPADVEALRARASSLLARLIATQQQDGGWPWAGAKGSDGPTSALALGALGRARAEGLAVPADVLDLAIRYAEQAFRNAPQQGDELKAQLQYALAFFGRSDFGALNRLHRARTQLSSAALAYVCLALVVADKGPMAAEVAELIEQRAQPFAAKVAAGEGELVAGCRWDVTTNTAWNRSPLETAAVAVLALESASPKSAAIEKGVQFLLQQRPWFPARAAGMVWAALARFYGDVVPERSEAVVHVRVNDHDVQSVKLAPGLAATNVDVPDQVVGTGRVKVELALEGRARPAFLVALRGFTPDVARRELADLAVADPPLRATAPIERGRPLPTGFGVLVERPKDAWTNEVSELPLGGLADVHLTCRFGRKAGSPLERDHFVLEVPLPAGADLLDGSVHGDFLAFHERPGSLLFELGPESAYANLDFTLLGRVAGEWRVLPPAIRSSSDLDLQASGDAHTLRVLPRGVATHDAYRPTPDELFERGKRLFDAGEKKLASEPLARLLAEFGDQLRDEPFRDVARMLLFADLEAGDPRRIVRSFEVLKEKDPDFTLDFESVLKVGSAYRALEEHERALLLERAVVDETFGKDLKVAGLLASEHRFRQSFELREKLWLDYPDSPSTLQSYLALSDEMLTRAPNAHEDKELREQGLDRATLQRDGMRILMRFLAFQPDDPLAPEAGLGLVSAWLSLQDYAAASELAGKLAQRFADPRFADSFLYSKAVAEWSLGHDDVATGLLERIATVEYTDTTGHRTPSANRALAWYILGQIHHARREAAAAVACYEKVAEQFPDAREALAGIRERTLALPEVTIARPGEKAKVTLTSRNLGSAELLVYPVDLMTLCLREKNLSHIADVNLAGIAPVVKADVTLAKETGGSAPKSGESGAQPAVPAGAFVPAETSVELGLDQAGAYLVLARAEEHHASGLVLVTPLDLQVKEDASGRVRTHVLVHEGPYVRDVETKVIGSQNDAFVAGSTDPRGLFVADGIRGTATVIARHGKDEYAFWRGTTFLGPPATKSGRGAVEDTGRNVPAQQEEQDVDKSNAYFRNVLELNRDLQNKRKGDLEKEMKKNSKGVQLKQTQ